MFTCLPTSQEVTLHPRQSRIYIWYLDPYKFGLPASDETRKIKASISYRKPPYFGSPVYSHGDSFNIEAIKFLGGQLDVGFDYKKDSAVTQMKDRLNVTLLDRYEGPYSIHELWQFIGYDIDTM